MELCKKLDFRDSVIVKVWNRINIRSDSIGMIKNLDF